jgi:hypothetical protein
MGILRGWRAILANGLEREYIPYLFPKCIWHEADVVMHRFPNTSIWVTEYNYDNQELATTQSFYNTSAQTLDGWAQVERYSLFGAFRSSKSNVGPNAAMLSAGGQLTDIGAWYLDRPATGVLPSSTKESSAAAALGRGWIGVVLGGVAVLALLL